MVGELPREGNLPVPLPLVTDLDGDGRNEVVLLANGGTAIRVLSVPIASGETMVSDSRTTFPSPGPLSAVFC